MLVPCMTDGSLSNYTDRSLIAIASSLKEYVSWPTGAERAVLARMLYASMSYHHVSASLRELTYIKRPRLEAKRRLS